MKEIEIKELENWYQHNFQSKIQGRRLVLDQIQPLMDNLGSNFDVNVLGSSFKEQDIYGVKIGKGKVKVLIWTQMHGNESTGTKALFDLFKFLGSSHELNSLKNEILENCQLFCVPILNPDGAEAYTRVNAQQIDLNRDVIDKKARESQLLQSILLDFRPEYCFNMHDQRTIFSVGKNNHPATISFLAPSEDKERTVTKGRIETMKVIVSMNNLLQKCIPNQIGRYTDEFYPTATGDNFQKMGFNTILIESGHFFNDYQREITRKYTFIALLQGLLYSTHTGPEVDYLPYFEIPDNEKNYLDVIVKGVELDHTIKDIGLLFVEKLDGIEVVFIPKVETVSGLSNYNANRIIQGSGLKFNDMDAVKIWLENTDF